MDLAATASLVHMAEPSSLEGKLDAIYEAMEGLWKDLLTPDAIRATATLANDDSYDLTVVLRRGPKST
jgi:hypothetical protein